MFLSTSLIACDPDKWMVLENEMRLLWRGRWMGDGLGCWGSSKIHAYMLWCSGGSHLAYKTPRATFCGWVCGNRVMGWTLVLRGGYSWLTWLPGRLALMFTKVLSWPRLPFKLDWFFEVRKKWVRIWLSLYMFLIRSLVDTLICGLRANYV